MSVGGSHEPNLTPFIDLFSVLTCFLLMTAAWIQLDSISVKMGPITSAPPDAAVQPPPPPPKKLTLNVEINENDIVITKNEEKKEFNWRNANIESAISQVMSELTQIKAAFANEVIDVTLTSKGAVYYGDLIKLYDGIINAGWESVAISPY